MASTRQPSLIFVSHGHEDNVFSAQLVEDLRTRLGSNTSVWHDISGGLQGGVRWWPEIISQISACDVFLLVMSLAALRSMAVSSELDMARVRRLQGKAQILPVLYQHCEVPLDLMTLQYVSFLPPRSYEQAIEDLIKALDALPHSDNPPTAVLPLGDRLGLVAFAPSVGSDTVSSAGSPIQPLVASTALIMSITGAFAPRLAELPGDFVRVGRAEDNDIVLPDPTVSRHHLHLHRAGSRWRIHRAPEAGEAFLNGQPCDDAEIVSGDQVVVGGTVLRCDLPSSLVRAPTASLPPTLHTSAIPPQLIVDGADCHFVVPLRVPLMTIGRAPESTIVIPSPVVSAHHALLRLEPDGGCVIEDAGSRGGLYVNGQRVPRHTLHPGDMVSIAPDIPGQSVTLTYSALR